MPLWLTNMTECYVNIMSPPLYWEHRKWVSLCPTNMQEINNVNKKYHLIDYNKWLSSKTNPFTQRQEVCTNVDVVCRYQLDMKGQIYL